ncbi:hypothetical protein KXV99_006392, partial [Aspergillus fumigatus]
MSVLVSDEADEEGTERLGFLCVDDLVDFWAMKKQTKKEKKIEEEKEGLWRWDRFNVAVMINPTNIAEYML